MQRGRYEIQGTLRFGLTMAGRGRGKDTIWKGIAERDKRDGCGDVHGR